MASFNSICRGIQYIFQLNLRSSTSHTDNPMSKCMRSLRANLTMPTQWSAHIRLKSTVQWNMTRIRSRVGGNTICRVFTRHHHLSADPGSRAVYGVGLRPLACWDCGFESRCGNVCLSLVNVVCCQVDVSATGRSLVQRSPTECVCVWDWEIKNHLLHTKLKYTLIHFFKTWSSYRICHILENAHLITLCGKFLIWCTWQHPGLHAPCNVIRIQTCMCWCDTNAVIGKRAAHTWSTALLFATLKHIDYYTYIHQHWKYCTCILPTRRTSICGFRMILTNHAGSS
jgi:hypothetical protein